MILDPKLVKKARKDIDAFVAAIEKCANKDLGASAEVVVIIDRMMSQTSYHVMVRALEEEE